jgi:CRP/FNR family cyclic AMP-dependent transcriptional regulator
VHRRRESVVNVEIDWEHVRARTVDYAAGARIFGQGEPASSVLYIDSGIVRLTVVSSSGREGIVAVLTAGHFFGEGCLAGHSVRSAAAIAMTDCTIKSVAKLDVLQRLSSRRSFADAFVAHLLQRNIRIEADLVDQLFNSIEKRLARTLLLLARQGVPEGSHRIVPNISQELLAEMVGTTRTRVNFFMNKFKKLGFIRYEDGLYVNNSLFEVLLRD